MQRIKINQMDMPTADSCELDSPLTPLRVTSKISCFESTVDKPNSPDLSTFKNPRFKSDANLETYQFKYKSSFEKQPNRIDLLESYLSQKQHSRSFTIDKLEKKASQASSNKGEINVMSSHPLSLEEYQSLRNKVNKLTTDNSKLFSDNKRLIEQNKKIKEECKMLAEAKKRLTAQLDQSRSEVGRQKKIIIDLEDFKIEANKLGNQFNLQKQMFSFQIKRLNEDIQIMTNFRDKQKNAYFAVIKEKQNLNTLLGVQRNQKQMLGRQLEELKKIIQNRKKQEKTNSVLEGLAYRNNDTQMLMKKEEMVLRLQKQLMEAHREIMRLRQEVFRKQDKRKFEQSERERTLTNLKIMKQCEINTLKLVLTKKDSELKDLRGKSSNRS